MSQSRREPKKKAHEIGKNRKRQGIFLEWKATHSFPPLPSLTSTLLSEALEKGVPIQKCSLVYLFIRKPVYHSNRKCMWMSAVNCFLCRSEVVWVWVLLSPAMGTFEVKAEVKMCNGMSTIKWGPNPGPIPLTYGMTLARHLIFLKPHSSHPYSGNSDIPDQ